MGRPSNTNLHLKDNLMEMERLCEGNDDAFGVSLLTFPGYISSSRAVMFASHVNQSVTLLNPDFPRVFTNYENVFGDLSSGYYKTKSNIKVIKRVSRYQDKPNYLYNLFIWNEDKNMYDVIEKKNVEDLTEKYGYRYNNEMIDSLNEGDEVSEGTVLSKTTSYDPFMNYCMGKNLRIMFTGHLNTIEDAILVRQSIADSLLSTEVETVKMSFNDNDIPCNLYGDNDNYKAFPDIGEQVVNQVVCSKRRIFNNQILYDLKKSNLRKINFNTDIPCYSFGKNTRVEDIMIYSNKEMDEIPDTPFYKQIKSYLSEQNRYWQEIYDVTGELLNSGQACSKDIKYLYKRSERILDPEYKWKDDSSIYSNMIIEFTVSRDVGLISGNKLTGRYGNKGITAKVVPDEDMYYTIGPDGEKRYVDCAINWLGVINRGNSMQLYEVSINRVGNRLCDEFKFGNRTIQEKEYMLFKFYDILNKKQGESLYQEYRNLKNDKERNEFFDNLYDSKLFVHLPILYEDEAVFLKIKQLYDAFDFLGKDDIYIRRFGREVKVLRQGIVGEMFMLKLKQTSKKQFSARSLAGVGVRNIPEKSSKAKMNLELYPKTPIRMGEQECYNLSIGIQAKTLAEFYKAYRTSPYARQKIAKRLIREKKLDDFNLDETDENVMAQMLNAYLKVTGKRISFSDELLEIEEENDPTIRDHKIGDELFFGTDKEYEDVYVRYMIEKFYKEDGCFIGTKEEYDDMINSETNRMIKERYNLKNKDHIEFMNNYKG